MFEAHKIYSVNLAVFYAQYANSFVLIRFSHLVVNSQALRDFWLKAE